MKDNEPDDWQRLFDDAPVDTIDDEQHTQAMKRLVMQAYDEAAETARWKKQLLILGHFLMTSKIPRYAATIVGLIVAVSFFVSLGNRTAFAIQDVIDNLLESKNVSFVTTMRTAGQPPIELKGYVSSTGQMRQEMGFGKVSITDYEAGKVLMLDPNLKTAVVIKLEGATDELKSQMRGNRFTMLQDRLRQARENPEADIEELGEKEIDGKTYRGFRIDKEISNALTVWADPDTNQPFLIETGSLGPPPMVISIGDFDFNQELDPSLFATTVPEGYRVIEQAVSVSGAPESALPTTLKMYCKLFEGEFPSALSIRITSSYTIASSRRRVDRLTQLREAQKKLPIPGPKPTLNPEQLIKKATEESTIFMEGLKFVMMLPEECQAHYAGDGVNFGETNEQPIFWYRPKGQDQWRVLGADLKFRDEATAPDIKDAVPLSQKR